MLYRLITKEELELLDQGFLLFKHPLNWGVNESIMTEVFGHNGSLKKNEIRKRVKKLVDCYTETFYPNEIQGSATKLTTDGGKNREEWVYYDVYTGLEMMLSLTYYCYCQCWTKDSNNDNIAFPETNGKYVERISTLGTISEETRVILPDDRTEIFKWEFHDVEYMNYTYGNAISAMIQKFKNDERTLKSLICLQQEKHSYQNETRLMLSPKNTDFRGANSLNEYISKKYGCSVIGCRDDVTEALIEQSEKINDFYAKLLSLGEENKEYLKVPIPEGFICNRENV